MRHFAWENNRFVSAAVADKKHPCHNRNPPKMLWFATICRAYFAAAFFAELRPIRKTLQDNA